MAMEMKRTGCTDVVMRNILKHANHKWSEQRSVGAQLLIQEGMNIRCKGEELVRRTRTGRIC